MAYHYSGLGPPALGRQAELLPVLVDALRESNVGPGQKVLVYTDTKKNKELVDAFYQAAVLLGAETAVIYTLPREVDRTPLPVVQQAMAGVDMILDLASSLWIYTDFLSQLLDEGKRILSCVSDIDTCLKMRPTHELGQRVRTGGGLMAAADEIRVDSRSGTCLTLRKAGRKGAFQDGLAINPGDWDCYPSHQVACAPLEGTANGRLVLDPGDLLVTLKRVVTEPVVIEVKDGRITSIEGKTEAILLREWFLQWKDPNAYGTSHIGFGCDPRADVGSNNLMEWETIAGGMMIAFGANTLRFLGGNNRSLAHIDLVLRQTDFALDGVAILREGAFVHPELII
ncbi:MAG: hypothetical protein ACM30E_01740 [Nitrososphaerales archaeon]